MIPKHEGNDGRLVKYGFIFSFENNYPIENIFSNLSFIDSFLCILSFRFNLS